MTETALPQPRFTIGTAEHFRWLDGIVRSVIVLNLLDAIFTLAWIQADLAEEGNVLMRDLAHGDALTFMLAKLTVVSLGIYMLWRRRSRPLAVVSVFVAFLLYYVVLLYHLEFSSILLLS
ncbi:MAG: DUF5658 family protein [Gemmatimonadetes bacterium]|nr:DUF5658 family protein [Gemmatimonadota bacterium]